MHKRGKSISYIANKYGVSYKTVKYHLSEEFKKQNNKDRLNYINNNHTYPGATTDRIEYKKYLITNNKRLNIV